LLLQCYAHRLIALARRRLGDRLHNKVDPEDVLQSVFRSFFRRQAAGEWDLTDANSLWGLLVRITLRKCNRRLEYYRAARRDVRREVPLARVGSAQTTDGDAVSPEPTPAEAALLAEAVEVVMNRLGTDTKRRVFELSLQGYSVAEISDQVGYYERGVERARAEARALLVGMMHDESPSAVPDARA